MEVEMLKKYGIVIMLILSVLLSNLFADKSLERIANELGVEGETKFGEGNYLKAASKFEEAIAKFNEAVEKDGIPQDEEKISAWLFNAYQSYLNAKDFENAIRIQNKRTKLAPSDYKIVKEKAIIYAKYLGNPDKAIETLTAFDNKYNSFSAKKLAAKYYKEYKKDLQNALVWYKKAFEQKQDSRVLQNIATLHKELGNNKEAIKAYEDYIQTKPNESKLVIVYKNLANLYDELKNTTKSIEYYEKANSLKQDDNITLLLIIKYYDIVNYDKSLQKIELLLQSKPGSPDAIYYRALIKFDRGEKAAAKADFEKLTSDSKYGKTAKGYLESIASE